MKKIVIGMLLFILLAIPVLATPPFDAIPSDKYAHLFASGMLTEAAKYHQWRTGDTVGVVIGVGLLKECYDYFWAKSEFSWSDLGFDILGIGLGLII